MDDVHRAWHHGFISVYCSGEIWIPRFSHLEHMNPDNCFIGDKNRHRQMHAAVLGLAV